MRSSQDHNGQVHPEIEHLEDLRLGERQHDNSSELCHSDSGQYTASRAGHRICRTFAFSAHRGGVRTHNMRDEFDANSHGLRGLSGQDEGEGLKVNRAIIWST